MFNNYGFGGYLVWAMGPDHKVFLDGRGDVYERGGVLADYLHIAYLEPGAFAVLQNYGIRSCLVERDEALATALWQLAGMEEGVCRPSQRAVRSQGRSGERQLN